MKGGLREGEKQGQVMCRGCSELPVSVQTSVGRHLNYRGYRGKQETPQRRSLNHIPRCRDALSLGCAVALVALESAYLGPTLRSREPVLSNWYLSGHYSQ